MPGQVPPAKFRRNSIRVPNRRWEAGFAPPDLSQHPMELQQPIDEEGEEIWFPQDCRSIPWNSGEIVLGYQIGDGRPDLPPQICRSIPWNSSSRSMKKVKRFGSPRTVAASHGTPAK
ncbi:hypothetical protein DM860_010181 [Cuscuta australis]|uniref:Uncharacterized protein n=1 Tax=Cuscuta australis TaxID=267555 RepID=A0A328D6F1_9ASTE|nr:hypothetical protein DM860_010181 [Cuscuta australis]